MAIFSTTSGFHKPHTEKDARNRHLTPEVTLRMKRVLTGAKQEMQAATSVLENDVEYYMLAKNGRQCTCTQETLNRLVEEVEESTISLQDFIMNVNKELPNSDYCPLCFGTKLVGGYKRIGVDTLILDSTLSHRMNKLTLIREKPFWFKPANTLGKLTWIVTLPKYYIDVLNIAIKWKSEPSQWAFKVNGEVVTRDLLNTLQGEKVTFELEMRDSANSDAGLYGIFIQLQVNKTAWIRCDMPRHTISYTGPFNATDEVQDTLTINFDSSVSNISTRDLIVDPYGLIWRIIECEKGNPAQVKIYSTCQARLVRDFEKYYFLPSKKIAEKYLNHEYTFLV